MKIISFKGYHGTDTESCKNILNSNYKVSQGDVIGWEMVFIFL